MAINALNSTQLSLIERDLNGLEILMPMQIFKIAEKIDEQIRFPKIKAEDKYKVICKIIKQIDRAMYSIVPNEYYDLINKKDEGIENRDSVIIKQRLSNILSQRVNIPILTEYEEKRFIEIVVDSITEGMEKGKCLC